MTQKMNGYESEDIQKQLILRSSDDSGNYSRGSKFGYNEKLQLDSNNEYKEKPESKDNIVKNKQKMQIYYLKIKFKLHIIVTSLAVHNQ